MRTLPRFTIGLLLSSTLLGCSTPAPKPITRTEPKFSNRTESNDPSAAGAEMKPLTPGDDGATTTASLLAQKLAAYSNEMSPRIRDRAERKKLNAVGSGGSAAGTPAPAAQPSDVVWAGSNGLTLSPSSTDAASSASVLPAVDSASVSQNQQIALASPARHKSADVPQIVPEGEDLLAPTGPHDPPPDTDALLQQLTGKIRDNPRDLAAQLDYQLIQFLRGEQVPQMKSITGLPSEDREVLTALLDGLSNFRSNVRNDSNQMLSQKIRPLVEMADRLRGQADLTLPNAALCTRVDGYGVYDPIAPARFSAGKDHPVIVYCEVENFASLMNEKKLWETKLSNEVILYTETGMVAWSDKSKSIVDQSRNRRHDFFIVKKTKLPNTLQIGRYILKISVTDQQSNRVAETTIPVTITAE